MKSLTAKNLKLLLLAILIFAATTASAQDGRLRFEKLDQLESRALDVVEVSIDGKLLDLAKRVMTKTNDENAKKIAEAISGLKGIYVRVFRFANDNEYNVADVDEIRQQLNAPGWERLANVRSKRNNQKVDVYTQFANDRVSGFAVVVSEAKSIALVNIIGSIDIDLLAEIGGKLNIPKIEIEQDDLPAKPKN